MKTIERIDKKAPVLPRKKRVAAYARVSMESERMQHSLSAQVSYYSALIQKNPEWEYAGVYADYGISGTGMKDRDEFKRMLADCEAGAIDIILTKSIQRFARNTVDLLNTIRHLKELGIEVRFEKENIHSLSGDGELMLTILASFAQEESRSISENCKWGIRKRYERGETGGCKIYGYRTKDGNLVIHEEEAVVVRRIFQMFLDGDSCYSIAQKLNAEGVPSYHRKRFNGEVIGVMIRQEKYTGCTLAQKFYAENRITHKMTKNKGELPMFFIEETHPAIVRHRRCFRLLRGNSQIAMASRSRTGLPKPQATYYRRDGEAGPHPPHRKPHWSEEQRKSHSEYFRNRETAICRYEFSHFIECENCHGHLQAQLRHFVDGSSEVASIDPEHSERAKGTPRPLAFRDSALKKQIADALGWEAFDADAMLERRSPSIGANVNVITLYFKDTGIRSHSNTSHQSRFTGSERRRPDGNGNKDTRDA